MAVLIQRLFSLVFLNIFDIYSRLNKIQAGSLCKLYVTKSLGHSQSTNRNSKTKFLRVIESQLQNPVYLKVDISLSQFLITTLSKIILKVLRTEIHEV